jgi:hypothetical protein
LTFHLKSIYIKRFVVGKGRIAQLARAIGS